MKLAGIIYLYNIAYHRMLRSYQQNYDLFETLCVGNAVANVVLVTTMWGRIPEETGVRREEELKKKFWVAMLDRGSIMKRYMHTTKRSAWDIVDLIVSQERLSGPLIQREPVDQDTTLPRTSAGSAQQKRRQNMFARLMRYLARV
jgi:hypothetical protein